MEEIWKQVAEHFGFLFPVAYAWGTYKFFDFLDQKISSEAKESARKHHETWRAWDSTDRIGTSRSI